MVIRDDVCYDDQMNVNAYIILNRCIKKNPWDQQKPAILHRAYVGRRRGCRYYVFVNIKKKKKNVQYRKNY